MTSGRAASSHPCTMSSWPGWPTTSRAGPAVREVPFTSGDGTRVSAICTSGNPLGRENVEGLSVERSGKHTSKEPFMKLPLTSETFSRGFLAGKGAITVGMAGAAALSETQPFPDGTRALVVAKAGGSPPSLKFGTDQVTCQVSFQGEASVKLTICQPGDPTPIQVGSKAESVPDGKIGALIQIKADGSAKAGATVPGPAGF